MAEFQDNTRFHEVEFLAFLNEIDFDGMNEDDSNDDMNEDDSNEDDSNEDGMNEDDVNEIGMDLEQPPDNVPLNRSTDSDTLAVQRSESLLSFSPACHRLFQKYKLSNLNEEQGQLDAFITSFNLKHSLVQEFSRIVNGALQVPSARVNLQQHLSQYIESEQYDQRHKDWAHTMMHLHFKKSVDKCRRTLQELNLGVMNKIQIDLCHVYGLLYLGPGGFGDGPTRLNAEFPSTVPGRATLVGLLNRNPKVVQFLLYLSATPRTNGAEGQINEEIYIPEHSHMNIWGNPQTCPMATDWLLPQDANIYRNPLNKMQAQLNSTRQKFEAIVIVLASILKAAHKFLKGLSVFEIAPYFELYGVSRPKSRRNGVLL